MHLARPPQNQGTLEPPNMRVAVVKIWKFRSTSIMLSFTVWLVIFAGTNFHEIGRNSDFRNFRCIIFVIGESRTHGDCFRSQPCTGVWIVRLCLRSILVWITSVIVVKGTLADTLL